MRSSQPSTARKLVRGALGLLLLAAALLVLCQEAGWWVWTDMEDRDQALVEEAEAVPASRPVLWGEVTPGDAWDEYSLAMDEAAKIKSCSELWEFLQRNPRSDRAAVESLLALHGGSLDHLRRGAHRSAAENPCLADILGSETPLHLLRTLTLASLAACQARMLHEAGHDQDAADLLLDLAQFGCDRGRNGDLLSEMIAMAPLWHALDGLREVILDGHLGRKGMLGVERALEVLDGAYPRHALALINGVTWIGAESRRKGPFIAGEDIQNRPLNFLEAWRYGFSTRWAAASAFEEMDEWMHRLAACDEAPWSDVRQVSACVEQEMIASTNPIIRRIEVVSEKFSRGPWTLSAAAAGRQRRAQLRLLRIATHYRVTGEFLELDDPFGTRIHHEKTAERIRFWSVGPEGIDNHGVGGWKPGCAGNIVLEFRS